MRPNVSTSSARTAAHVRTSARLYHENIVTRACAPSAQEEGRAAVTAHNAEPVTLRAALLRAPARESAELCGRRAQIKLQMRDTRRSVRASTCIARSASSSELRAHVRERGGYARPFA